MTCGRCGATHYRPGQRWCRACNTEYMREWRRRQTKEPIEVVDCKWDCSSLLKVFGYPSKEKQ